MSTQTPLLLLLLLLLLLPPHARSPQFFNTSKA
jgi:hypothetical protein